MATALLRWTALERGIEIIKLRAFSVLAWHSSKPQNSGPGEPSELPPLIQFSINSGAFLMSGTGQINVVFKDDTAKLQLFCKCRMPGIRSHWNGGWIFVMRHRKGNLQRNGDGLLWKSSLGASLQQRPRV